MSVTTVRSLRIDLQCDLSVVQYLRQEPYGGQSGGEDAGWLGQFTGWHVIRVAGVCGGR